MKYAIVIPDGAADEPLDELDGLTPFEAADIPNIDWIAANGKIGTVLNIPKNLPAGSDVAILSVLGYDPRECYTGRAPLEAAAIDLKVGPDEWIFRCNLVTIINGVMEDYCAGHISTEEGSAIIDEMNRLVAGPTVRFYSGISYRHLMTFKGKCDVTTTPPHDIINKPIEEYLPAGKGAEMIRTLVHRSGEVLGNSEINAVRRDLGENPATHIWLWGQGKMPHLPSFADRFGVRGVAITAVDLVRGLSKLIGWDCIEVEGATGYFDTNYAGKGAAAVEALDTYDLVLVHIEAPDEAGHNANSAEKIKAIEQIDRHVVAPLLEHLRGLGEDWRILVLPDHPTPCTVRTHTRQPVPFAIAGKRIEAVLSESFSEKTAAASDLHVKRGYELMEYFLRVR